MTCTAKTVIQEWIMSVEVDCYFREKGQRRCSSCFVNVSDFINKTLDSWPKLVDSWIFAKQLYLQGNCLFRKLVDSWLSNSKALWAARLSWRNCLLCCCTWLYLATLPILQWQYYRKILSRMSEDEMQCRKLFDILHQRLIDVIAQDMSGRKDFPLQTHSPSNGFIYQIGLLLGLCYWFVRISQSSSSQRSNVFILNKSICK